MVQCHHDTLSWWLHKGKNLGPVSLSPETATLLFKFTKNRDNRSTFSEVFIILKRRETKRVKIKKQATCNSGAHRAELRLRGGTQHGISHGADGWTWGLAHLAEP